MKNKDNILSNRPRGTYVVVEISSSYHILHLTENCSTTSFEREVRVMPFFRCTFMTTLRFVHTPLALEVFRVHFAIDIHKINTIAKSYFEVILHHGGPIL